MHQPPGGPPPEAYLKPLTRRHRAHGQELSIRTPSTPSLSRHASSYSSRRPGNAEKKSIPANKLQHASKLYSQLRMKKGLAQLSPDPNATSPSSVGSYSAYSLPGPLTNASRSSRCPTTLSCDAASSYSSVMSFDTASQSSARSVQKNEAVSYKGDAVPQRTRKKLNPVGRVKTALIRYLGACQNCKIRNVECPLEHHDIESLELAYQSKSIKQEVDPQHCNSTSPTYEQQSENTPSEQATPVTLQGQYELWGVGGGFGVTPEVPPPRDLALSPGAFDLETSLGQDSFSTSDTKSLDARVTAHYSIVQNGGQFRLGVWDNLTCKCYFLDGDCPQVFSDAEALQTHFETAHFQFTRINPCHRYICSRCCLVDANYYSCTCGGTVKLFICGNYIRIPSYPPEPPGRQPSYYTGFNTSTIYPNPSSNYSVFEQRLGFDINGAQDIDNNTNASLYGDGSNMYPSLNGGDSNAYTYASTQPGGIRYNGYAWTLTQGVNKAVTIPIRYYVIKFGQTSKYRKTLISILLSLTIIIIIIGHQLYHWITSTIAQNIDLEPSIPTFGFIVFLVSFVTSSTTKNIYYEAKKYKMVSFGEHSL